MFLSKLMWRVSSINRHLFFIILYLLTVVFWVERVVSGFSRVYRRLTGVNAIDRAMEMSRESDDVAKFRKKTASIKRRSFFFNHRRVVFFLLCFLVAVSAVDRAVCSRSSRRIQWKFNDAAAPFFFCFAHAAHGSFPTSSSSSSYSETSSFFYVHTAGRARVLHFMIFFFCRKKFDSLPVSARFGTRDSRSDPLWRLLSAMASDPAISRCNPIKKYPVKPRKSAGHSEAKKWNRIEFLVRVCFF